jgi:hypothetical protein
MGDVHLSEAKREAFWFMVLVNSCTEIFIVNSCTRLIVYRAKVVIKVRSSQRVSAFKSRFKKNLYTAVS